jgi:hypothetical protein
MRLASQSADHLIDDDHSTNATGRKLVELSEEFRVRVFLADLVAKAADVTDAFLKEVPKTSTQQPVERFAAGHEAEHCAALTASFMKCSTTRMTSTRVRAYASTSWASCSSGASVSTTLVSE